MTNLSQLESEEMYEELVRQAQYLLWRNGTAHEALLDENQQKWRAEFLASDPLSTSVWNVGRQVRQDLLCGVPGY